MSFNEDIAKPNTTDQTSDQQTDVQPSQPSRMDRVLARTGLDITDALPPETVLKSPDTTVEQKKAAMQALSDQEEKAKLSNAADKFQNYQKYMADLHSHMQLTDQMKARGMTDSLPQMPNIDDYNITPGDVALFSHPQIQEKVAPVAAEKQAQQAQNDNILKNQQEQTLGQRLQEQQNNLLMGQIAAQSKLSKQMQDEYDRASKSIDDQQTKLDQIDPNRFWNSRSTGQKILGTLAIALGEVGKSLTGSSTNVALDIINKHVDQDIAAQKVNNDQKMALKQNALKRVQLEISKLEASSKDSMRQFEMKKIVNDIQMQREALKAQQAQSMALNNKLFNGGGIDAQTAETMLSPDQKARTIAGPNGNIFVAHSKDSADKANAILSETQGAMAAVDQFKSEASKMGMTDKLNPFSSNRAAVVTSMNALIGKLRVPITGPGILNQQEYERLSKDVLGDPTSLTSTPRLFEARINALTRLLKTSERATYKQAGVNIPMSKADQVRIKLYKAGIASPEAIEQAIDQQRQKDPSFGD